MKDIASKLRINDKLSQYTRILDLGDSFCFLNSLSLNKIYISKKVDLNSSAVRKFLKQNYLFNSFDVLADKFVKDNKNKFKPELKQLYLIVTEKCNFNCKYCRQITHGLKVQNFMSIEEAQEIIDNFFRLTKNKPEGVVFYGGEPLLNKRVLIATVKYLRKKEKKLHLKKSLDLTVITNGSNIDKRSALVLKNNNVYVIISIDGRAKEHDKMRVYQNGMGTFKDVIKGYQTYKDAGCNVGISCTVGSHNYKSLDLIFDYFGKKLKPINIGINLPHGDYDNPLNYQCDFKLLYNGLFNIFEKSTRNGLYIEHIMRKLRLLFNQETKINDCPACGGRIVMLPGKQAGICEGAIGLNNYFFKDIKKVFKMSEKWYLTAPIFDRKCIDCLALGICGGGCPFDGHLQSDRIGSRDNRRCFFMKQIVKWGLYNFYLVNRKKINNNGIFIPKKKDQVNFLKSLHANRDKLPLRSSANFSKVKI